MVLKVTLGPSFLLPQPPLPSGASMNSTWPLTGFACGLLVTITAQLAVPKQIPHTAWTKVTADTHPSTPARPAAEASDMTGECVSSAMQHWMAGEGRWLKITATVSMQDFSLTSKS